MTRGILKQNGHISLLDIGNTFGLSLNGAGKLWHFRLPKTRVDTDLPGYLKTANQSLRGEFHQVLSHNPFQRDKAYRRKTTSPLEHKLGLGLHKMLSLVFQGGSSFTTVTL